MARKAKKTAEKEKVLTVDNSVNPKAKTVYVAYCNFTTMKKDKDGELENTQIKKGDEITAREVPQIWIEQAVSQKFLIPKEVYDKEDKKGLAQLGYR